MNKRTPKLTARDLAAINSALSEKLAGELYPGERREHIEAAQEKVQTLLLDILSRKEQR